tara:strand:+ start:293 stop:778 length:486 start_codon:yes stop_codon:yes gene_type:complete
MFIAHVPAGYLLTRSLRHVLNRTERLTILVGSLLPDVDLLLFYFRDGQSVHHHTYLTHRPVFWLAVVGLGLAAQRRHRSGRMLGVLGKAGLLHLILDTVGGAINWGWPMVDIMGPLVVVPASRSHWVLSFLTHWTFAIEVAICLGAIAGWSASKATKNPSQ